MVRQIKFLGDKMDASRVPFRGYIFCRSKCISRQGSNVLPGTSHAMASYTFEKIRVGPQKNSWEYHWLCRTAVSLPRKHASRHVRIPNLLAVIVVVLTPTPIAGLCLRRFEVLVDIEWPFFFVVAAAAAASSSLNGFLRSGTSAYADFHVNRVVGV